MSSMKAIIFLAIISSISLFTPKAAGVILIFFCGLLMFIGPIIHPIFGKIDEPDKKPDNFQT
ncbi:hypothetical protein [Pseudoalteromonas galatheae]|uniref:hypothetical protein n=1 Tax=Pseudoalteromonas galatheae TaxID=579562 RepID=UPI0030D0413C